MTEHGKVAEEVLLLSGETQGDDGLYRMSTWDEVVRWVKEWDRME